MQKTAAENKTGNTSYNTRLLGGKKAAANCRSDGSVTVHSLRSGGVMSPMQQLQQAWNVGGNLPGPKRKIEEAVAK